MKELLNKLSKAKLEIKPIVKSETNPFYKSKYFDINDLLLQIEPILHSHGLILLQPIEDNKVMTKIYDVVSGQCLESSMILPELNDPQKMGSAVTYYRRYTLQSALALQAEDDDGNNASKIDKPKTRDVQGDIVKGLLNKMNSLETLADLATTYKALSPELQIEPSILKLAEHLKTKLK